MAKFKVKVTRIGYSATTLEIEAENEEQAKSLAVDEAGGHEFPGEHSSDYEADYVEKVDEGEQGNLCGACGLDLDKGGCGSETC